MLTTLYLAILGRAPDAAGLAYWTNQWEQGMSLRQITLSLMQSEEVQARYPSTLADEAFVTQLYFNLFDRGPDANGLNYWLSQLEEGAVVRESMVLTLLNAAFAGDGEDAALLRARTEAAERYLAEQESGSRSFDLREAEITLLQIRRHLLAEEEAGNDEEPNGLGWLFDRWPTDPPALEPQPEISLVLDFSFLPEAIETIGSFRLVEPGGSGPDGAPSDFDGEDRAYGLLESTGAEANEIESFFGLAPGELNSLIPGTPTNGSAIKIPLPTYFDIETITFTWNFATRESVPNTTFDDFSFFFVAGSEAQLLSSVFLLDDKNSTGWQKSTFNFQDTGASEFLGFGVLNAEDRSVDSLLAIDEIELLGTEKEGASFGDFWLA